MGITYLTLKLTDRCNMNCYMCGQKHTRKVEHNDDLNYEIIRDEIKKLDELETVYLFGGEPLLYEKIDLILKMLYEANIDVLITTNGLLLDKYIDLIVDTKVRDITISIDSISRKKYNKIRGCDGMNKVISNLKALEKRKKEKKSVLPHIGINCVVLPENVDELEKIYNYFCQEFEEIERINFESPINISKKEGKEYEKIMKDQFGIVVSSWKGFSRKIEKISPNQDILLKKSISRLSNREKVTLMMPESMKNIINNDVDDLNDVSKCDFAAYSATVMPNGNVTYCTDFPDYIVGNIYEDTLNNIFNNEKSRKFKSFLEKNVFPICSECPRQHCNKKFFISEQKEMK